MKNLLRVLATIPLQLSLVGCLPSQENKTTSASVSSSKEVPQLDMAIYECNNLSAEKNSYIQSVEQIVLNSAETFTNINLAARELSRIGCSRSAGPIVIAAQRILSAATVDSSGYLHVPFGSGEALVSLIKSLATVRSNSPIVLEFLNSVATNDKIYGYPAQEYAQRVIGYLQNEYTLEFVEYERENIQQCSTDYLLANGNRTNYIYIDDMIADIIASPTSPYLKDIARDSTPLCDGHNGHYRALAALETLQLNPNEFYPFIADVIRGAATGSILGSTAVQRLRLYNQPNLGLFRQYILPFLDGTAPHQDVFVQSWLLNALYMTCNVDGMMTCADDLQPIFESHVNDLYFAERLFAAIGRDQMIAAKQVTVVPSETLPVE